MEKGLEEMEYEENLRDGTGHGTGTRPGHRGKNMSSGLKKEERS